MKKNSAFKNIDTLDIFKNIPTPSFIIDKKVLLENCRLLKKIQDDTGCKILLAQKCFSNYDLYPLIRSYTAGTEASGLYEARLGFEKMPGKEVHTFCGAFKESEFNELMNYTDHIVFNTPNQLKKFGALAKANGKSIGLRLNPEHSTQSAQHEIYDPCRERSRLGTTRELFDELMTSNDIKLLDGIHFHTLCEQNSDDLETTIYALEEKFGDILTNLKWINFGGGHHITRDDYDIDRLVKCINYIKNKYHVEVYLEPGEAWALNAGYLYTEVLDVFKKKDTYRAIVDASAACHVPDVVECPYKLNLLGDGNYSNTYLIGGPTCLSGDFFGEFSFKENLKIGDKLLFGDMANYTTVKTNTFNGMPLPSIYVLNEDNSLELIKEFGYKDFEYRLGK